jgi:sulfatase maturation enzyme AslB (radical SAM superfamily)
VTARVRSLSTQPTAATDDSTSLIPTTLAEMDADTGDSEGVVVTAKKLREVGQARLTREEKRRRRRALDALGVPDFAPFLADRGALPDATSVLSHDATTMLQVNVGLYCNQACTHCHVESSPKRTETMSAETVQRILGVLAASPSVTTVDITGGAPEM